MCEFKIKEHLFDFVVVTFFMLLWRNIMKQMKHHAAHCLFIYHVLLAMLGSELNFDQVYAFFSPHSLCFCNTLCLSTSSLSMIRLHKWPGTSAQTQQTVPAAVSTHGEDTRGWNADTDCSQLVNPPSKQKHRGNAYSRSTFNNAVHRISLSSVNCPITKLTH